MPKDTIDSTIEIIGNLIRDCGWKYSTKPPIFSDELRIIFDCEKSYTIRPHSGSDLVRGKLKTNVFYFGETDLEIDLIKIYLENCHAGITRAILPGKGEIIQVDLHDPGSIALIRAHLHCDDEDIVAEHAHDRIQQLWESFPRNVGHIENISRNVSSSDRRDLGKTDESIDSIKNLVYPKRHISRGTSLH